MIVKYLPIHYTLDVGHIYVKLQNSYSGNAIASTRFDGHGAVSSIWYIEDVMAKARFAYRSSID